MSRFTTTLAATSTLIAALSSSAVAQPGGTPAADPPLEPAPASAEIPVPYVAPVPPPPVAPPATIIVAPSDAPGPVDQGVLEDPNADRAWLAPTALTQPAGSWSFNDYELAMVGLTYGVTDTFQISGSTLLPLVRDQPFYGNIAAKAQVVRSGRTRLAAHGVLTYASDGSEGFSVGAVGGAGTLCLDDDCHSMINGYLATAFAMTEDDGNEFPVLLSASVVGRLNKHVKLVGEIDTGFVPGEDFENVYLGWYGVRFASGTIAGDVGFVRPFGTEVSDDDSPLVLGVPWVNFTYRAL